jgi:hypothetical protein
MGSSHGGEVRSEAGVGVLGAGCGGGFRAPERGGEVSDTAVGVDVQPTRQPGGVRGDVLEANRVERVSGQVEPVGQRFTQGIRQAERRAQDGSGESLCR